MDRLVERLPSPGGFALWLYALAFVLVPALLAWKGFAYVLGIVIFAVGLRPHIDDLVAGRPIQFALHWRGQTHARAYHVSIPDEGWAVRAVSWALLALTVLVLPLLVYVVQEQGVLFVAQIERQLPLILEQLGHLLEWLHAQLPGTVPRVDVSGETGWAGLSSVLSQVAGDAMADINGAAGKAFGSLLSAAGVLVGDWVKLIIGAIIVGTILAGWDKEVAMHRAIISRGIKAPRLRANVLRFGELFQSGVSLFMIGYLEVAATLTVLFALAMLVLPLGLGLAAILFMSVVLGIVTAIPKIGGFVGMGLAFLLMATNIDPGLGWFGMSVVSFGWAIDTAIRTALLMAAAKVMGLLEAYSYTPEIVGRRLGLTKMQIIGTIVIWAVGAGFFGMIWGILLSLAFQAALRLSQEDAAHADALAKPATARAAE